MGLNITSQQQSSHSKASNSLPQFLDLEPEKFQELYALFTSITTAPPSATTTATTTTPQEIKEVLASRVSSWGLPLKASRLIASAFYSSCTDPLLAKTYLSTSAPDSRAQVSRQDLEYYIAALETTPDLPLQVRRALLAFAVFYRRNYHPKQWVQYDRKSIFFLAGLSDMSTSSQEALTTLLHKDYGFDLRVIGSKSPIPCFYFDWMASQQLPGLDPSNPLIDLGPYAPQTIASTASKTPDELYDLIEGTIDASFDSGNNDDKLQ